MLPFDAVECLFEAPFDQPLANVLDGLPSTIKRVGDLLVSPSRAVGVRLQKNLGTPDPLARALELLDDRCELFPFLIRESNHINLPHTSLHALPQHPFAGSEDHRQSQKLNMTKH